MNASLQAGGRSVTGSQGRSQRSCREERSSGADRASSSSIATAAAVLMLPAMRSGGGGRSSGRWLFACSRRLASAWQGRGVKAERRRPRLRLRAHLDPPGLREDVVAHRLENSEASHGVGGLAAVQPAGHHDGSTEPHGGHGGGSRLATGRDAARLLEIIMLVAGRDAALLERWVARTAGRGRLGLKPAQLKQLHGYR